MSGLGLAAWLVVGAALFCFGVLAAATRRDRGGVLVGLVLMLAATMVTFAALVRHAVLPAAALSTLLVALVLGGAFVLVLESISAGEDRP